MGKISLPALLTQLFQDTRSVLQAEVRLAKSKAVARVKAARTGLILLGAATFVAMGAIVGFILALLLAIIPYLGAFGAGLTILILGLAIAGLLGWLSWKMMKEAAGESSPASQAEDAA